MFTIFRYLLLCLVISISLIAPAFASEKRTEVGDAVIAFFENPPQITGTGLTLKQPDRLGFLLMDDVIESVVNSDTERLRGAVLEARNNRHLMSERSLHVLNYAETIQLAFEANTGVNRSDALYNQLSEFRTSDNWYIRSTSNSLIAFILVTRNETVLAARQLDSAMDDIPTELSDWSTGARLLVSEVALALHGLQGNPEFMLEAADIQYRAKMEIGEAFNRYELMTNFIYAFNRSRNFEAAAKLAELLLVEERPGEMIEGLSEVYIAQTYIELRRYRAARDLAMRALQTSEHPQIRRRADYAYIVALAGLGEVVQARSLLREKDLAFSQDALLNDIEAEAVIHAESLLAMHEGDATLALALMQRRADLIISRVQKSNSTRMTTMLSNLENSRDRQAERETALAREAALKAEQLEQQTKTNRLLWVLLALLTLAFNLLLAFLRYREKNNRKVQTLQDEALSAEKMKTEFLGVVNHELRTPLNGIIGISDAMIHHASDPTLKAQAEAVQQSGQLLFDLLDSLITMSTIEGDRLTLESEETDLSRIITSEVQNWDSAAEAKDIAFSYYVAEDLKTKMIGDAKRLRQCVRYLLSNAVRFTHDGRIHLHATAEADGPKHMRLNLIVADTGQGMSEDVQKRLFKPFLQADSTMTRKYGGAGLSLAIARKLARMMEGDLTVTSREGCGSEFLFTARLPCADVYSPEATADETYPTADKEPGVLQGDIETATYADVPTPAGLDDLNEPEDIIDLMLDQQLFTPVGSDDAPAMTPLSTLSVLVGDDMTLQTSGLRAALKSIGCRTVPCDNSKQFLERLARQNFDLVILNLRAPALGGTDTLSRIGDMTGPVADVPVIVLDQAGPLGDANRIAVDMASERLTHPVTGDELVDAINRVFAGKAAA